MAALQPRRGPIPAPATTASRKITHNTDAFSSLSVVPSSSSMSSAPAPSPPFLAGSHQIRGDLEHKMAASARVRQSPRWRERPGELQPKETEPAGAGVGRPVGGESGAVWDARQRGARRRRSGSPRSAGARSGWGARGRPPGAAAGGDRSKERSGRQTRRRGLRGYSLAAARARGSGGGGDGGPAARQRREEAAMESRRLGRPGGGGARGHFGGRSKRRRRGRARWRRKEEEDPRVGIMVREKK